MNRYAFVSFVLLFWSQILGGCAENSGIVQIGSGTFSIEDRFCSYNHAKGTLAIVLHEELVDAEPVRPDDTDLPGSVRVVAELESMGEISPVVVASMYVTATGDFGRGIVLTENGEVIVRLNNVPQVDLEELLRSPGNAEIGPINGQLLIGRELILSTQPNDGEVILPAQELSFSCSLRVTNAVAL